MQMEMNEGLGHGYLYSIRKHWNGETRPVVWNACARSWYFLRIERLGMKFPLGFAHSRGLVLEPVSIFSSLEDPDAHSVLTVINRFQLVIDLAHFVRNFSLDADHSIPTPSYQARNYVF